MNGIYPPCAIQSQGIKKEERLIFFSRSSFLILILFVYCFQYRFIQEPLNKDSVFMTERG